MAASTMRKLSSPRQLHVKAIRYTDPEIAKILEKSMRGVEVSYCELFTTPEAEKIIEGYT